MAYSLDNLLRLTRSRLGLGGKDTSRDTSTAGVYNRTTAVSTARVISLSGSGSVAYLGSFSLGRFAKITGPIVEQRVVRSALPGVVGEREYWMGVNAPLFRIRCRVESLSVGYLRDALLAAAGLQDANVRTLRDQAGNEYQGCSVRSVQPIGHITRLTRGDGTIIYTQEVEIVVAWLYAA